MKGLTATAAMLLLLLGAGCNKGGSADSAANVETASKVLASAETSSGAGEAVVAADYQSQAGTELALSDDEKVLIVSVADLDEKSSEMEGLVAIEGRVAESYPDKGTIILVDCDNMKGCADGCCPQTRVPVRLSSAGDGQQIAVPGVDEMVIVVADLSLTETGYNLAVRELRKI